MMTTKNMKAEPKKKPKKKVAKKKGEKGRKILDLPKDADILNMRRLELSKYVSDTSMTRDEMIAELMEDAD